MMNEHIYFLLELETILPIVFMCSYLRNTNFYVGIRRGMYLCNVKFILFFIAI